MNVYTVTVIGPGKLGGALALALADKHYEIQQFVARNRPAAEKLAELFDPKPEILTPDELGKINSDIVIISTPESEIPDLARHLAKDLDLLPYVYHTSGSVSSRLLIPLSDAGCEVASMHPLVSISDVERGSKNFKGAYFCLEGNERAVAIGTKIVDDLEGRHFSIRSENKPLYHASAVTACGHLVALISVAVKMLAGCGLDEAKAQEVLLPLVKSTFHNLSEENPVQALTGTFARADIETMRAHLRSISENMPPEVVEIYRQLGLVSIGLALQKGADTDALAEMRAELQSIGNG